MIVREKLSAFILNVFYFILTIFIQDACEVKGFASRPYYLQLLNTSFTDAHKTFLGNWKLKLALSIKDKKNTWKQLIPRLIWWISHQKVFKTTKKLEHAFQTSPQIHSDEKFHWN